MKKFALLIFGKICISISLIAQTNVCGNYNDPGDYFQINNIPVVQRPASELHYINVFIHIIRKSNGTQGVSLTEVLNAFQYMKSLYSPNNICFNLKGNDFIDNNEFFKNYGRQPGTSDFNTLITQNAQPDAIDIYVVPKFWKHYENIYGPTYWGLAESIVGSAFVMVDNPIDPDNPVLRQFANTPFAGGTMAHEMGHCLGLWHTHHGTFTEVGSDPGQCPELVNGTNGTLCGDYCLDTPADPNLRLYPQSACQYTVTAVDGNGQTYMPNPNNIMSYALAVCWNYFSNDQVNRMFSAINTSPILQMASVPVNRTLTNMIIPFSSVFSLRFTASNNVIAGPNVTVNPPGKLDLVAGNEVIITPGFSANYGSILNVYIGLECEAVNFRQMLQQEDSIQNNNYENLKILRDNFMLFPNPATNTITLKYNIPSETNGNFIIYDLTGKEVFQQTIIGGEQTVLISDLNLKNGVYIYKIAFNGINENNGKLVIISE